MKSLLKACRLACGTVQTKLLAALLIAAALLLAACGSPSGTSSGSPGNTPGAANTPPSGGQTAGKITEFPLPSGGDAQEIIAGPDGNLWFTEASAIGRSTPAGQITEFPITAQPSKPADITAGPDKNLWFTDDPSHPEPAKIGRITP